MVPSLVGFNDRNITFHTAAGIAAGGQVLLIRSSQNSRLLMQNPNNLKLLL